MNKKCLLVVLLTMLALVLTGCSGEKATKAEYFTYIVETDGTVTITGYIGNERAVVIPKKIDGHKVCCIGDKAFAENTFISTITIQKGVRSIGHSAFSGCENLTEVILPNTVEFIGLCAFQKTKITSITIPEGVTGIYTDTFAYCSRLKEVNLPSSIKYIYDGAFAGCKSLKGIVIPNNVELIGDAAFCNCTELTTVTMPAKINGDFLVYATIGARAFSQCESLQTFVVPEGIHTIGDGAFHDCSSLKEITIPESVTSITDGFYSNREDFRDLEKINVKEGSYAAEYFKNHKGLTFY